MPKQQPEICVYTTLHDDQLKYAEKLCREGSSDGPFCFHSKKRWATVAQRLQKREVIPLLIRNIQDEARPFRCTFVADIVEVRFASDFVKRSIHRKWIEDHVWMQKELYEEEMDQSSEQFAAQEVDCFLDYKTHYLIRNVRRVGHIPLEQLTRLAGPPLSSEYKYGYVVCLLPPQGSPVDILLKTAVTESGEILSADDLEKLNEKYAGTPEYRLRIVNAIKRPSVIRNAILRRNGTACQVCGCEGFEKKGGGLYAETHHMIELNEKAPESLQTWNVIVCCPTCHRKLHYANVSADFLDPGWKIVINGAQSIIK